MQIEKIEEGKTIAINKEELDKIFLKLEYNLDDIMPEKKEKEAIKEVKVTLLKVSSNINKARKKLLGLLRKKNI
jgi:hypothetical protein